MKTRRKRIASFLGIAAGTFILLAVAGVGVVRSHWFQDQVRERIVREVERVTGARAELGSFTFDWRTLRAEARHFVLHGDEPAGSRPLFQANRIVVGLKVVSALRRDIDIALLEIDRPELSIQTGAGGRTNLPARLAAEGEGGRRIMAPLLDLKVREFRVTRGLWRYDSVAVPFAFEGRNLNATATYDASVPGYHLRLSGEQLSLKRPETIALKLDTAVEVLVSADGIRVDRVVLSSARSRIEAHGRIDRLRAFQGEFAIVARLGVADAKSLFQLPVESAGTVRLDGLLTVNGADGYSLDGKLGAEGLAISTRHIHLEDLSGTGFLRLRDRRIEIDGLRARAPDGLFRGRAVIEEFRRYQVSGEIRDVALANLMPRAGVRDFVWNGTVSGPLEVSGEFGGGAAGNGDLQIAPRSPGRPLAGHVDVSFDTAAGTIGFTKSQLATGSSRVDFSGSLRNGLRISVYTEHLPELLPVCSLLGWRRPDPFPIRLEEHGVAQFGGLATGVLGNLGIAGHAAAGPFLYDGRLIDDLAADFDWTSGRLRLRAISIRQGTNRARGEGEVSLPGGAAVDTAPVSGRLEFDGVRVGELARRNHWNVEARGSGSGKAEITGTIGDPTVTGMLTVAGGSLYGESFDEAELVLQYSSHEFRLDRGAIRAGKGRARISGRYTRGGQDWHSGQIEIAVKADGFRLAQFRQVRERSGGLDAALAANFEGTIELENLHPRLTNLNGEFTAAGLILDGRALGKIGLTARTARNILSARATAGVGDAKIRALAEWSLARGSFGLGQVEFSDLTLATLQDLGLFGGRETELPVVGSMDGEIGFTGPVLKPSAWRGMAKVTRMEITPTSHNEKKSDRDLTLRNAGALLFAIEPTRIVVDSARLISPDTDLEIDGTLSYLRRRPWDLRLRGSANLAVLTAFREDLVADGKSTVDANIRGSLLHPQINGRLEFRDASVYLRDLPNGLEQVNGSVLFNRTRATIEKFTSKTGGGDLELAGFIGFGGDDWVYRLQAKANRVRVRYPPGTSTLFNASLDLTGSSTRSLLSGDLQVTRAAFNPSSDLGSILADTATVRPPAEISNPFLRGMNFDVHVTTASNAQFLTSLTRDLEIRADLRLRGSPARPVLLGRIGINRGEIQFFGNKYDIVQGEITFFNPVKIEPVVAMDLETRVRSYTVMMNFSGPLDKLNFSYRSDPPLQSQEIIALLTVGRTPTYTGAASTSSPADTNYFQTGGSSFLGYALTSPVSSRLERFFGVSRIKIDPQLTGVDNTPETHVTIEQQISREITLTYVTNLARTQQQIVRIEWNFQPDWSFYAVRDSNGVFGVDFVYRRRFK